MFLKGVPPRAMLEVMKKKKKNIGVSPIKSTDREISLQKFQPKVYEKPKVWSYTTKPFFRRIKEPLVDVFNETNEVWIIIDLGNFTREEIESGMKNGKYVISGRHNEQEFIKEIELPEGIDINNIEEHFKAGTLELKLFKKKLKKKGRG